jgi:signal transduction histidine kinase/ActR/RegA family two-component response regulator
MNLFAAITLAIGVLQLSLGLVVLGVMRAPGWRGVWPFAVIALSAGLFSLVNVAYILPEVSDATIVAGMRINYLVAAIHCAGWVIYAHADQAGTLVSVRPAVRSAAALALILGLFFALTGAHLVDGEFITPVAVVGTARYRLGRVNAAGMAYGGFCLLLLAFALRGFAQRVRREGRPLMAYLVGFAIFFACAADEVLVMMEVLRFYSLADIGFLAIIVPVAGDIFRRFVEDARRLRELSDRLTGEVAERTHERDQAQVALLEAERHAALGRLAAGVGHEINNPLTYLWLNLETLERWLPGASPTSEVREALSSVQEATDRIGRVVEGLRTATRSTTGNRRLLEPMTLCESALRVARPQLRHVATVSTQFDEAPNIDGDEAKLVQVLVNLLNNAAHALEQSGVSHEARILVRTGTTSNGDAIIAVSDNGPGIPPEHLARVTEPYFTTRASSGGTGLGLFLSREMIEQHGGTLAIQSSALRGTTVRLVLPPAAVQAAKPVEAAPSGESGTAPAPAIGERTILLVDDEPRVVEVFSRALAELGIVQTVTNGLEAMHVIDAGLDPDAIVCDLMMPGLTGIELRERLLTTHPHLVPRMLFITGGAVTDDARGFVDRSDVRVAFKPMSGKELRAAVRESIADSVLLSTVHSGY